MTARSTERCPGCGDSSLRRHVQSRASGLTIQACTACGAHVLEDRDRVFAECDFAETDDACYSAYLEITRTEDIDSGHQKVINELTGLVRHDPQTSPSLFDVGAGYGRFLALARNSGFAPHGNELSAGAIRMAHEEHDVTLLHGDLAELPDAGPYDAVTMWCVLAHVPRGDDLLKDVHRILAPGGVLFMQTPRWSLMDRVGLLLHDLTRGRFTKITDRRMAPHHMCLHTQRSMTAALRRLDFDVIDVSPRSKYSLTTINYLASLKIPQAVASRVAPMLDMLIARGWFFRNVLDVYARKPAQPDRSPIGGRSTAGRDEERQS